MLQMSRLPQPGKGICLWSLGQRSAVCTGVKGRGSINLLVVPLKTKGLTSRPMEISSFDNSGLPAVFKLMLFYLQFTDHVHGHPRFSRLSFPRLARYLLTLGQPAGQRERRFPDDHVQLESRASSLMLRFSLPGCMVLKIHMQTPVSESH
jgi:hypothetical protein